MKYTRLCKLLPHARKRKTPSCAAPVSFTSLPHEALDTDAFYGSIVGTNCENVVGYVPLPVGVVGPLIIDRRPMTVPLATTEAASIVWRAGCRCSTTSVSRKSGAA